MSVILAVGIHPDDIELGAGGMVCAMLDAGHRVVLCDLTSGEPTPMGSEKTRAEETAASNKIMGVTERMNLRLPNRWLEDSKSARVKLAEVYRNVRPDVLLIPHHTDAHPDHIAGAKICEAARFIAKYSKTDMSGEAFYPTKVFAYLSIHLRRVITPDLVFDISEVMERKMAALRAYHSQFFAADEERGELLMKRLEASATFFGASIGKGYGEPLLKLEEVGISSFDNLLP